jgi:hypothetical protein
MNSDGLNYCFTAFLAEPKVKRCHFPGTLPGRSPQDEPPSGGFRFSRGIDPPASATRTCNYRVRWLWNYVVPRLFLRINSPYTVLRLLHRPGVLPGNALFLIVLTTRSPLLPQAWSLHQDSLPFFVSWWLCGIVSTISPKTTEGYTVIRSPSFCPPEQHRPWPSQLVEAHIVHERGELAP